MLVVRTLADSGPGSLRAALAKAARGGGIIRFSIAGGIKLDSGLDAPGHTTIDGSSAPPPGITLWGEHAGAGGTGVVNIADADVVIRGLRIRNGMNDGVHIAPRNGHAVANVVVDHCSITNNADGGIDLTGSKGIPVSNVTIIGNYFAGNGGACPKGWCGGASLMAYGADRVSYYYNVWDKSLRRTPSVTGAGRVADVRYNVVRSPEQGGIQIRDGARANVVGNTLDGPKATIAVKLWGGHAYVEGNPSDLGARGDIARPLPAPNVPASKTAAEVMAGAGASRPDAVDSYYRDTATTFAQVQEKDFPH
ncbi:MAG TPA: right-handed parallel beta-helix repeat-containing protein [Candidatus Eisenbacteria bacterium]|nr:right-handed parallel beta-helix repeat-containing protein [Candidatus Eisenbacteria bacterium]